MNVKEDSNEISKIVEESDSDESNKEAKKRIKLMKRRNTLRIKKNAENF